MSKRVLVVSDLHCGHNVGLTPSCDTLRKDKTLRQYEFVNFDKYEKVRQQCWAFFISEIEKLKPIDICIANGDMIDGRGEISGGTELLAIDRLAQCELAIHALKIINAKDYVMTYGTGYHTGKYEDFENVIANRMSAKIGSHEWVDVNGIVFDIKHKIGKSSVPYGQYAPIGKDQLWNTLWAERQLQPNADILIRSHIHEFNYIEKRDWIAITTPALQGMGSKFGSRECSGLVDFGVISFDISNKGDVLCQKHLANLVSQKAKVMKL